MRTQGLIRFCQLGLLLLLTAGVSYSASTAPAPRLATESFFRRYDFNSLVLSPDGSKVAVVARQEEGLQLFVIDLATKQPRRITNFPARDVAGVAWLSPERLLFKVTEDSYDVGGLFAINADGSRFRVLAESIDQQGGRGAFVYRDTNFLSRINDEEILVVSNERLLEEADVYRLNTYNGRRRLVARNPGGVSHWVADHTGAVRAAFGERGLERFVLYRDRPDGEWREVRRSDIAAGQILPLQFTADNRRLYVSSNVDRDTAAIMIFDPTTGEMVEEIFADAHYDVEDVLLDRQDHRLLGVAYDAERPVLRWLDPGLQRLQTMLDEALPDTRNRIVSRSHGGRWAVILAHTDRDPGTYYLLQTETLAMEQLVRRAPWIEPDQMAEMRPIEYRARDGMTMHGYLTLPVGGEGRAHPLIVNPHGGPWARDTWGFNREVQFLANRGYAVLQINFRGSTGYGRRHLEAGYNQWGLAMQDDITDGVRWAIEQGYADPVRVAIYGASYGGYATMAGLAFTPELYRCGINYVGVTDIELLLRTIPKWWEPARERLEAMTGHARRDRERLRATSPLRNVANIRAPVLLAYGEQDPRVVLKHAQQLVSELKRHDKPHEVIIKRDEGHGFYRLRNQLEFYGRMEKFLAQHMQ
jgi:dipeptidyl aminopeptidase/acylaminoacyl peptidase